MARTRYSPRSHYNANSVQADYFTDRAGTDLTATMAELNTAAGVTAGTVTASKGVVVGTLKEVDTLNITGAATQGGTGAAGAAGTLTRLVVRKTGIANNTATAVITVTVPNGMHAAAIRLTILGHLGTGTDTFESARCAEGLIVLARQTGAATVAVAATLALAQIATAAGGGTLTLAYGVSSMTGAVGATQTFDITLTLVVTGTITDHQAVVFAELVNSAAGGVTMAQAA